MGRTVVIIIPYKTFKERIRLTKEHLNRNYIENMNGFLYLRGKGDKE